MEHMSSYADYCPIAVGVDVLGDRWTPLVIRELMIGATGFNEIHRGIPRISRTLLAQRLRQLERRGLVHREAATGAAAGRHPDALGPRADTDRLGDRPVGRESIFGDPAEEDCDGLALLSRLHQHAIPAKLPEQRTVVHLVLTGNGAAEGWLCAERRAVTVCKDDPGYDIDLAVEADAAQMQRWAGGARSLPRPGLNGHARILGPSRLARSFPSWFDTGYFAQGLRRADRRRQLDVPA